MGQLPPENRLPIAWTPYLASDDVDRTAEAVRLCGGTVAVGPLDAAEAGRLAIAADPSGAVFGIWQAPAHLAPAITGVPGTPAWNELITFETESVAKFYASVFGYEREPVVSAGFDYVTLCVDGRPVAGVHGVGHGLPRDRGPYWATYFEVGDTAETLRQVTGLGGRIVRPAHDSPHGGWPRWRTRRARCSRWSRIHADGSMPAAGSGRAPGGLRRTRRAARPGRGPPRGPSRRSSGAGGGGGRAPRNRFRPPPG